MMKEKMRKLLWMDDEVRKWLKDDKVRKWLKVVALGLAVLATLYWFSRGFELYVRFGPKQTPKKTQEIIGWTPDGEVAVLDHETGDVLFFPSTLTGNKHHLAPSWGENE